jgi:hypothetical protein
MTLLLMAMPFLMITLLLMAMRFLFLKRPPARDQYWRAMRMFLRGQLQRKDLDQLASQLLGRDHVLLHNRFLRALHHNAQPWVEPAQVQSAASLALSSRGGEHPSHSHAQGLGLGVGPTAGKRPLDDFHHFGDGSVSRLSKKDQKVGSMKTSS